MMVQAVFPTMRAGHGGIEDAGDAGLEEGGHVTDFASGENSATAAGADSQARGTTAESGDANTEDVTRRVVRYVIDEIRKVGNVVMRSTTVEQPVSRGWRKGCRRCGGRKADGWKIVGVVIIGE